MKKLFLICCIIAGMLATQFEVNAQSGVLINVWPTFNQGIVSGGINPLCYNGSVTLLSGTPATGGDPATTTYQWERSLDGGLTWTNILGATGLNYDPGQLTVSTTFRRHDINSCTNLYTNQIAITVFGVFTAGTLTAVGTTTVCNGVDFGSFTGTPATGGDPVTNYQWQNSIDGGVTWNNILGATALNYDPAALLQTTMFRRQDVNLLCGTLYTNAITINVWNVFAAGTATLVGSSQVCNNTDPGMFTGTPATGGNPATTTYQWQNSIDGGITWNNILGATTQNYDPAALSVTTMFRRQDTNTCGVLFTNVLTINVFNVFAAGTITPVGSVTICNNTDFGSFAATAATGGDPVTNYQWQSSIDGGTTWTNILGATLVTYDPAALTVTTSFRRQDVNLTCGTLYTNTSTITVYTAFSSGVIGSAQNICNGTIPLQLFSTTAPSGGDGTYTYFWEQSTDGGTTWTVIPGATLSTYQPVALIIPTKFRRYVTSGSGCGGGYSAP
jgi:hypothetical protein